MRILVIGGGGREHALIWKLAQSRHSPKLYCAPGNAGIARSAECINLKPADLDGLANFADAESIDLTVVGPEGPLAAGIVVRFEARALPIFGPSIDPARIEGSKIFAKELMVRYGIPTAEYWPADTPEEAQSRVTGYFKAHRSPGAKVVIKADGLAAGKGVVVAANASEAHAAVDLMMVHRAYGEAGDRVIIEECIEGEEASIMAFTDGDTVTPMPTCQDHKRVFDNDGGPNTGGMGAYTPVPAVPPEVAREAVEAVLKPAVHAIKDLGIPYKGVLYAGIMLTKDGIKTLEFNCRFGDPETQTILPLLDSDLVDVMLACVNSELETTEVSWRREASVAVVAASGGYPGEYVTGKLIEGLEAAAASEGCIVFHAGTRIENGQIVTDGGRVLTVTAVGDDLQSAIDRAYSGLEHIRFEGIHYRHDIAFRGLGK